MEDRPQDGEIFQGEGVNQVIFVAGGKLDQADLFLVGVEAVGFRIHSEDIRLGDFFRNVA